MRRGFPDRLSAFILCFAGFTYRIMKDFPEECFDAKEIDDNTRRFDNFDVPTSSNSDLHLKKGWYRFSAGSGNSLKEGYPKVIDTTQNAPNFCGTENAGTLMGSHPTPEEGMVEMTVCFRDRSCFKKGVNCDCEQRKTIYVRNCLKHYIYFLGPTVSKQRYCSAKTPVRRASK